MRITVYLGSRMGNSPIYEEAIKELGAFIGDEGHTLVFGASNCGLMGILADTVLAHGGKVIGVRPTFLDEGSAHKEIQELIWTETMSERKTKMIELGDKIVAFPGGTGTLEEISEVIVLDSLGQIQKPYVFFNLDGYYESFKKLIGDMYEKGFMDLSQVERIRFVDTIEELISFLRG